MGTGNDDTAFFNLPLELRELIYQNVLGSTTQGPALLRTCHEVQDEAQKFLFRRPLRFKSLQSLYTWLTRIPPYHLAQVIDVSLTVQDVNLRSLLNPDTSPSRALPSLMTWDLYRIEIENFRTAMKALPNIKTLTIRALPDRQTSLYREYMKEILRMLGSLHPGLVDLRLEGNFHHQSLAFLSRLQHLRSFSFDGFSASSPIDVAKILSSLEHLSSLSLTSQHALLNPETRLHSDFTSKSQSFTEDVVRTMNQLASFAVMEHTLDPSPALFFTPQVLAALEHHKALSSLSVSLSHTPSPETLSSLEQFLDRCAIQELELDWPDLQPMELEKYRLVTGSLKLLRVRAKADADAFDILWSISESRGEDELHNLREIVLIRKAKHDEDANTAPFDREASGTGIYDEMELDVSCLVLCIVLTIPSIAEDFIVPTSDLN